MSSYMQKTAAANRLRKLAAASRVVRRYRTLQKYATGRNALIGAGAGAGLGAGGGYLLARAINAKKPYIWALGGGGVGALGGAGIGALLGNKKTDSGKAPSKGTSPSKSSPAVVIPSERRKKYTGPSDADIASWIDISAKLDQQAEDKKRLEENLNYAADEQMKMLMGNDEVALKSILSRAIESERRYPEHNDPAFPNAAHVVDVWRDINAPIRYRRDE